MQNAKCKMQNGDRRFGKQEPIFRRINILRRDEALK